MAMPVNVFLNKQAGQFISVNLAIGQAAERIVTQVLKQFSCPKQAIRKALLSTLKTFCRAANLWSIRGVFINISVYIYNICSSFQRLKIRQFIGAVRHLKEPVLCS
jgi:hypothetical protein